MKTKLLIITTVSLILTATTTASAATENFSTSTKTTYDVDKSGITTIYQNVTLTNQTAKFYAESYRLTTSLSSIYDVYASDSLGNCPVTVNKENINVTFNDKVVGLGAKLTWQLSYKTTALAIKRGHIWEINLPQIVNEASTNESTILKVPVSFGAPVGLKDVNYSSATTDKQIYLINKNSLRESGRVIIFGDFQTFNYTLKYHLRNPTLLPTFREIALPPSIIGKQETVVIDLDPKPLSVRTDTDGNILAKYWLWPWQEIRISLTGAAKTYNQEISLGNGSKEQNYNSYLKSLILPQPFWEVTDANVGQIVAGLKIDSVSNVQTAKRIYDYVVTTLQYNQNKGFDTRLGATAVLKEPTNAVCGEFADLFVTMCRAAGIPARELEGYADTGSATRPVTSDVLHAWAEFYDEALGWVPVDPTWGNTAKTDFFTHLDSTRLVLAIHGQSSTYPPPAGAYKLDINESDQISVTLGGDFPSDGKKLPEIASKNIFDKFLQIFANL